jgi:arabinose-5-phosphate isomerase
MKKMMKTKHKASQILKEFSQAFLNIQLDEASLDEAISILIEQRESGGKVITTGMGKAGIAMKKFASTLCSLGFPAVYLHPGEASHGDLGILTSNDVLFVSSTSGKTREILAVMDLATNLGVKSIVGITSHPDSPVRKKAHLILDMGLIEEAGHLGLAPTTSILVMLGITDCLAVLAAEKVGITKAEYGKYHHSGYLGSLAREDDHIF